MKTKITAKGSRYPLRAILMTTLIIAQLGATRAYAVGGLPSNDPNPGTSGTAELRLPGPQTAATQPATQKLTQPRIQPATQPAPQSSTTYSPTAQSGTVISRTIRVKAGSTTEDITFDATLATEAAVPGEMVIRDGQILRAEAGAPRDVMKIQVRGCDGTCPPIADLVLVRGQTVTMADLEKHLQSEAVKLYNRKHDQEMNERRLEKCQAVRGANGSLEKVTSRNRKELQDEIFQCQIDAATKDKSEDREDELLTLGEVSGSKIGGMLRRAMISEDETEREWAKDQIEKLSDDHGDDSAAVDGYLKNLGRGAEQIGRIMELADLSEDNPSSRNQVFAEFERAAAAWNPASPQNMMKGEGARRAISDVYNLMKAFGCNQVASNMNSTNGRAVGQVPRCNSIDSAVEDGRAADTSDTTPGTTTPTSSSNGDNVLRANRVPSTGLPGAQFMQTHSQQLNLQNPNQTPVNGEFSAVVTNRGQFQPAPNNGTVRGQRFQ